MAKKEILPRINADDTDRELVNKEQSRHDGVQDGMPLIRFLFLPIIFLLLIFSAVRSQDETGVRTGSIDFLDCVNCNDRLLYIPFVDIGYLPSGPHEYTGQVMIEIQVNESGKVSEAQRIAGHEWFGQVLAKRSLRAKFKPKVRSHETSPDKLRLKFQVTAPGDAKERKLGIINGMGAPMVLPEFPVEKVRVCSDREVRVRARFHPNYGRVVSAKAISGDQTLFESAEKAALATRLRMPNAGHVPGIYINGLLVYRKPKEASCPPIIGHFPPGNHAIDLVAPGYPDSAKMLNLNGTVSVAITVDEHGGVIEAKALSGHPLLARTAKKAALLSRFKPVKLSSGRPVHVRHVITYRFNLGSGRNEKTCKVISQ